MWQASCTCAASLGRPPTKTLAVLASLLLLAIPLSNGEQIAVQDGHPNPSSPKAGKVRNDHRCLECSISKFRWS